MHLFIVFGANPIPPLPFLCLIFLFFFLPAAKPRSVCPKSIPHILATGWEDGESLTLENEDAVAMGTVNPSVTQRVPGW